MLKQLCSLLSIAALTFAAQPASAQCIGPDGLDGGPCCGIASVNLPQFPGMAQDMRWLCFDQCQPTVNNLYCVKIGAMLPIQQGGALLCGQYTVRFVVSQCGAVGALWNGLARANYSRTWLESQTPGVVDLQVWRFTINGDFAPTAAVPATPCDRPGCMSMYSRVYFTGYIDYAFNCATGQWSVAFALDHDCDGIHHSAASVRPAPATGLHPNRSFTMVSPGSTFMVTSTAPIQSDGPIIQQAMRWNDWSTAPQICRFEEQCQGNFIANNPFCMCGPTTGAPQWVPSLVSAQSQCGSSVNPSPIGPFLQKRIGGWTAAAQFPGNEFLLIDLGYLDHINGCTGVAGPQWFEGVETIGGYPAIDFTGVALGRQFEDYDSCNTSPTVPATRIGAPHISNYILNFNLP